MKRPRVGFFGTPEVALPTLMSMIQRSAVDVVVTPPDRPSGRGQSIQPSAVKALALKNQIPIFQPERWDEEEISAAWHSLDIDLGIVLAYGFILPSWLLQSFPLGMWNLHFSLLPRWRGAAPVNHAIWAGDTTSGVCLMQMNAALDAGDIVDSLQRPITLATDAPTLLKALSQDAASLLTRQWEALTRGSPKLHPQSVDAITWAPKLNRDQALLDFHQPALYVHRQIRALQPWPGVLMDLPGESVKIRSVGMLKASTSPPGTLRWSHLEGAWLSTGDGQSLELLTLQRSGKGIQTVLQALQPWGVSGTLQLE